MTDDPDPTAATRHRVDPRAAAGGRQGCAAPSPVRCCSRPRRCWCCPRCSSGALRGSPRRHWRLVAPPRSLPTGHARLALTASNAWEVGESAVYTRAAGSSSGAAHRAALPGADRDTEIGPLQRRYGLATVTVTTASRRRAVKMLSDPGLAEERRAGPWPSVVAEAARHRTGGRRA
ncbi:hypothetical protein [Streptomyces thioluteus]|uniref:hypothetical protein n=1 Tax=Streptomyces thioluteus TaxID=66431 RepID=UPI0031F11A97